MTSGSRIRVAVLLLLTFLAGAAAGMAGDRLWGSPDGHGDRRHREEAALQRLDDELQLTPEQRSQVETILEHHRQAMKRLWEQIRPQFTARLDSVRTEIEGVLTPEQIEKYRKMKWRNHEDRGSDSTRTDSTGES